MLTEKVSTSTSLTEFMNNFELFHQNVLCSALIYLASQRTSMQTLNQFWADIIQDNAHDKTLVPTQYVYLICYTAADWTVLSSLTRHGQLDLSRSLLRTFTFLRKKRSKVFFIFLDPKIPMKSCNEVLSMVMQVMEFQARGHKLNKLMTQLIHRRF